MSRKFGWIGSALGGAIAGTVFWFVLNSMWTVNGRGIFERMGGPFASPWTFGISGAILGAVVGIVAQIRAARRERDLTELSQRLGLTFEPKFPREDLSVWNKLTFMAKVSDAWNRLSGEVSGVPFQVIDLRLAEGTGDNRRTTDQSVVLVANDEVDLPEFELRPRNLAVRFLSAVGVRGVSFAEDEQLDLDPEAMRQFQSRYFVSSGLEDLIERLADAKKQKSEPPPNSRRIRTLFSPRLLRFFAAHPGWQVQGAGQFLAIWRPGRLAPPTESPQFLAEALAIRSALLEAAHDAADVPAAGSDVAGGGPADGDAARDAGEEGDSSTVATVEGTQAGVLFMVLGAVPGFFAGGIGGGIVAATVVMNVNAGDVGAGRLLAAAVLFFGGAIVGLVSGGLLGLRVIAPAFERVLQRRRDRQREQRGIGPSQQPASSLATVDDRNHSMSISLPGLGMIAGGGGFLCVWSLMWNGMLTVMSPVFITAAASGNLKDEAGQPTSVWFVLLFLTPFWAIGIGSFAFLLSRARRRAEIRTDPDQLVIVEKTLFGRTEQSWRRDEIQSIRVESSRGESPQGRKVQIRHLTIEPYDDEPTFYFGYRDPAEVVWLARLLSERLELPSS